MSVTIDIYLGIERPSKKLLMKHVKTKVATKWKDLGLELGIDPNKLNNLENDRKDISEACCMEMFRFWLNKFHDASWYKLIYALKAIKFLTLADEIKHDVLQGLVIVTSLYVYVRMYVHTYMLYVCMFILICLHNLRTYVSDVFHC